MSSPLVDPREEQEVLDLKESKKEKSKKPDMGYIPVRFCTEGKLSAPEVLHFRNYRMDEALELSRVRDDLFEEYLIRVLNKMVWEDFDCGLLHKEEMLEVILNLHVNFWSKTLEGFRYLIDEDLPEDERDARENILEATINIAEDINIKNIPEKFAEPILIKTSEGIKYKFKLLRMDDRVAVKNKIDKEFATREKRYEVVKLQFIENPKLKASEVTNAGMVEKMLEYSELIGEKDSRYFMYLEYAQLFSVEYADGKEKEFETLEDKIKEADTIDLTVWSTLKTGLKDIDFGVDRNVDFYSMELNKKLNRRFRFRLLDFLPSLDMDNSSGNALSFGV